MERENFPGVREVGKESTAAGPVFALVIQSLNPSPFMSTISCPPVVEVRTGPLPPNPRTMSRPPAPSPSMYHC